MEADALKLMQAVELAKDKMAQQEEQLRTITQEYEALQTMQGTIRATEVDLNVQIEDASKKIKENMDIAKHWRKELAAICKVVYFIIVYFYRFIKFSQTYLNIHVEF